MRELYVYYTVAGSDLAGARACVHSFQAVLRDRHAGLQARVLQRAELAAAGSQTWMEVYSTSGGVSPELEHAIGTAAEALQPWLQGVRHTEAFVPCAL